MKVGMLWFDNRAVDLVAKMQGAIEYYSDKYGSRPDWVMCNPADFDERAVIPGVKVEAARQVLKSHLWIGRNRIGQEAASAEGTLQLKLWR